MNKLWYFWEATKLSFIAYVTIWTWQQWIYSLITLIVVYWIIMHYIFNEICRRYTNRAWLSKKGRCVVIAIDLSTNVGIGMYYMNYRDTVIGQLTLMCPLALSPFIFVLELTLLFVYCYYYQTE